MKKFVYGILILAVVLTFATLAVAAETKLKPSAAELKKMSTFISNFTELWCFNFDLKAEGSAKDEEIDSGWGEMTHFGSPDAIADLIHFGIRHNYMNNYKSRIKNCTVKDCEYGELVIDGKYVAESVKKYFDLGLKNQTASYHGDSPYYYDGEFYHFPGSDGEATFFADVKEVFKRDDGTLRMTGEIYNADDKSDRPAIFEATAKPHKFGGKDTWTILSMKTDSKE